CECLDRILFWTAADLEVKLLDFQRYFNGHRTHAGLGGLTPEPRTGEDSVRASVSGYRWRLHCRGLYQTPIAVMTRVRCRLGPNPYFARCRQIERHACPRPWV